MGCVDVPLQALPSLPSPLTLGLPTAPTLPAVTDITLCCRITWPTADLPYPLNAAPPLPPLIAAVPGIEALLLAAVGEVNTYLGLIPPDCPMGTTP